MPGGPLNNETEKGISPEGVVKIRDPSGAFNGKLKNVAGVSILGIGEVDRLSCLGVGSFTELPLKPETPNPKINPKTQTLNPKP